MSSRAKSELLEKRSYAEAGVEEEIDGNETFAVFKDSTGDRSVRTKCFVPAGSVLIDFSAKSMVATPTFLTVQVSDDKHIFFSPPFLQYINHSCDPNVYVDADLRKIISLKDLQRGDEVSFFYPSTEWSMQQPFRCHCRAERCHTIIRGAAFLDGDAASKHLLNRHIRERLAARSVASTDKDGILRAAAGA